MTPRNRISSAWKDVPRAIPARSQPIDAVRSRTIPRDAAATDPAAPLPGRPSLRSRFSTIAADLLVWIVAAMVLTGACLISLALAIGGERFMDDLDTESDEPYGGKECPNCRQPLMQCRCWGDE